MTENTKFQMQESQYKFPYHYIPYFKQDGTPTVVRSLCWGIEYLCYQKYLNKKIKDMNPNSVLDIGCGDGYVIGNLPSSISQRVGCDLSSKAIAFAKAFWPDCQFYDRDAKSIKGKFELVVAIEVLEHIPDESVTEFIHVLADKVVDNGRVIISVPTTVIPVNKKHYRHYTLELLKQQLQQSETGLEIETAEYVYSKPWWIGVITRLVSNPFFCLEVKFIMRAVWRNIWRNYLITDKDKGHRLIATLKRSDTVI
ncbi:class I SAM-dependent methyltransferase [Chitinispirillales bacterium ANBcel5]|uniref:class I SAM-dependent methyltransferase n=1 Tax=Cellulosispirillum alkaliphilum TaxID=3039283 RepID=UPI002A54376D|nr:class I SAM-dependent methyltransferase [Chitinispirillales bacterium ANBcel5]